MKKKSIIVISMIVLLFLSGCTQKGEFGLDSKKPEEITIWHYYNGAQAIAFEEMLNEFNNTVGLEKGIVVSAESKGSIGELADALMASANKQAGAEDMPNIFQSYLDTAVELDDLGVIADLNPYITEDEKAEYIDAYIEEGYFGKEGEWKLFPIAKSTEVLAINKSDWDKFKAATGAAEEDLATWEGINKTAEAYYEYSEGKGFFGRDAFANYMIIGSKQLGKEIFSVKDEKVTLQLDKDIMRKLWDNFYVPYVKGYYSHVGRYRTDDVKIGRIIAAVGSTSGIVYFPQEVTVDNEEPYPIERLILPIPNFEGTEPLAVQQGASMAVSKNTETKEYASVVFLKWFTQEERNIQFALQSGYMPVKKAANDIAKIKEILENSNSDLPEKEMDTFAVAIKEVTEWKQYTSKGFIGGSEARDILEVSMKDLAVQNRDFVLQEITDGKSEEEALEEYLQDKYFEEWFAQLKLQLEEICK